MPTVHCCLKVKYRRKLYVKFTLIWINTNINSVYVKFDYFWPEWGARRFSETFSTWHGVPQMPGPYTAGNVNTVSIWMDPYCPVIFIHKHTHTHTHTHRVSRTSIYQIYRPTRFAFCSGVLYWFYNFRQRIFADNFERSYSVWIRRAYEPPPTQTHIYVIETAIITKNKEINILLI
jgi:hypothetical protein